MWRGLLAGVQILVASPCLTAGGVFYNSNQSAEYLRTFERNSAVDDADIAYYNMAGTVRLKEGLTLNLSNQTIFQKATVATRSNPVLGDRDYRSGNTAWVVPNAYGVYRKGRAALFMGLETIGATAIRQWKDGLPTLDLLGKERVGYGGDASARMARDAFEDALRTGRSPAQAQAAALAAGLDASPFPARGRLEGSSFYMAWRWGAAFQVGPKLSLALAGRFVSARQEISGQVEAQAFYDHDGHDFRRRALLLFRKTDRASGWSGEMGLNLYPTQSLVLSFTFEMATPLSFRTSVRDGEDGGGLFVDGRRARLDLPMVLRFGLGYQATPRLRASVGMNAYLEKSANFGMLALPSNRNDPRRDYGNTYEEAAALEYQAGPRWLLSAGVNFNQIGQAKASTLDISIPGAHADYLSLGAGFRYAVSERLKLNAGFGRTRFRKPYENADAMGDQKIQAALAGLGEAVQPHKVYDKRYFIVAFGLDYHFSW